MTATMLAGRLNVATRDFQVAEVPVPEPGPGEVRVKVEAAGVCLSDVHLIDGSLRPLYLKGDTVTLGHETAGTVERLGAGVTAWKPGDRVMLAAGEERGGVVYTRGVDYDGGWAEFAVAAADTLLAIPDDLPFEQAAIIPDAVSTPWAAITTTGQAAAGRPAAVWGVGGLGAHAVQLLRVIGAAPIIAIDPLEAARDRALDFGADVAVDSAADDAVQRIREASGGAGVDVAFDFAGVAPVREQAAKCLGPKGRMVLVGLTNKPLTISDGTAFSYFQQQIRGHYGSEFTDLAELLALVRGHRVEFSRSISGVLPLADAPKAVERLVNKEGNPIRLVLKP
ncbi:zinc-binding dehydrogenase [Actinomadura parmotrematis]|uniref:Zinc-binding dehydrogenase n=1 Tax=Actinomadura parmotrematis TaxID=2864039 RepID=A0ABS7FSG8_9ACTN|nr:zinc-binding dehydrogenase [Actinomadura parmotrematis]MBW8483347.1 zinc-binding dehydrogenase [Actinomadura parmotrematis]